MFLEMIFQPQEIVNTAFYLASRLVKMSGGGRLLCMAIVHEYDSIISIENLLVSWREFLPGKRKRTDVQEFEKELFANIHELHTDLKNKTYVHNTYQAFKINDPKPRDIHKAKVRDRLVHHAIYRILYPYFEKQFIYDSYSCRIGKGTHRALDRFRVFHVNVSERNTRTCWVLKCDIRKFFASIDHEILKCILKKHIKDTDICNLLFGIINSFHTEKGTGLPLGNLTSQLLVNIYMNEFDHFVKYKLKVEHYIRYADDFVVFSRNKQQLETCLPLFSALLEHTLSLSVHPKKVSLRTISSGVDFLGWVHFPEHRVLRTSTKRKMLRQINEKNISSYLGMLSHGNAKKLERYIREHFSTSPQPSPVQERDPMRRF